MEESVVIDTEDTSFIEEGSSDYALIQEAQKVEIRDGDDLINIKLEEPEEEYEEVIEETIEETPQVEEPELQDFNKVEDIGTQLEENRKGFESMTEKAVESGKMTQSDIELMMTEYENNGTLSKATLDKLAEAGYPESFVRSYIQGQEALARDYTNQIYEYAGGRENFDRYTKHLGDTSPATLDALETAITNCDLKTIQGIMQLTREAMASKYGRPQQRTVTRTVQQAAHQPQGYQTREEMFVAMSDPRYGRDEGYTRHVENMVFKSTNLNLF